MNTEVKRHIDAARQVLVGVVPNPTSQIDQITNALIYKFMDDMDQAAIKAGGEPSFFVGDLEPYAWTRIMDSRKGNQERMNLYSEALLKFSESKQLPELFRSIFRSAFLPYRSPEVLGLFLKEIDYFDYSHPEELGNAYEYLLSVMSSQGDAGQFRTPRHIIDFIVDVVNPTKDDKVLDPACGTAGFLISAYKHIVRQHEGKDKKPLTPDERKILMNNFEGYDIDPGMVRIAEVNMYLHQFKNPKIFQYDSLSNDERWNDKFDVILANPPFMSPKGGIRPHNKFSVQSNRSEVLFVDYIMNHLRPKGRAGIIVPEGIIFQSGIAYKQLRKNLVEDGLYGVVSLPSGVFAPYSGVKTSVLLFDNEIAKLTKNILFVKIENDGFDLGATKRSIEKNDLPQAKEEIKKYREFLLTGNTQNDLFLERIKETEKTDEILRITHDKFSVVAKKLISEDGDYNLSSDRYKIENIITNQKWPLVELREITKILKGSAITKKDTVSGSIPVIAGGQQPAYYHNKSNRVGEVITVSASGAYAGFVNYFDSPIFASDCSTIQPKNEDVINMKYLYFLLKAKQNDIYAFQQGGGQPHVYPRDLEKIKIPLPPLEIQLQIVKELDGYQKIISGAKQVVENWKPKIETDPEWKKMMLGEVCLFEYGRALPEKNRKAGNYPVVGSNGIVGSHNEFLIKGPAIIIGRKGSAGEVNWVERDSFPIDTTYYVKIKDEASLNLKYLYFSLLSLNLRDLRGGGAVPGLNRNDAYQKEIFIPSLEVQVQIVERIEDEKKLIEGSKKLVEIYERKIKSKIAEVWGE